jgi:AcrR family transcriptional regulator
MTKKQDLQNHLIEIALKKIQTEGYQAFTLDAIAQEAGISKGGLLHHFPKKELLIEAMLQFMLDEFEARVLENYHADSHERGRWLRAYVRASFAEEAPVPELAALLLSALLQNPKLRELLQEDNRLWQGRFLQDGLREARIQIVWQAANAFWMNNLLAFDDLPKEQTEALLEELLSLIEES